MKLFSIAKILMTSKQKFGTIALTIASGIATVAQPSFGQLPVGQTGFRCDTSSGVPTTIYQNREGEEEPWIKWVSNHFSGSGWTPAARCKEVSTRLENYRQDKKLNYITLGTVNNQSVICVASQNNGPCEGVIYTLKPGQDAIAALNNLFAWRQGGAAPDSNYESVTEIPYIDVRDKLDEEVEAPQPVSTQSEAKPSLNREL